MSVIIETSIGDVTVDLYTDERPRCCLNFLKLCKIKYFNFSLFHTVQHDLVAQVGDPTATGRGGQSIFGHLYGEQARFFDMEVIPRILHSKKGLISMVNNGSGMHGSQFYFTLADGLDYLDGKHTVFGEVAEGMDIIDKLNNTFCDDNHRPHQDIRIYHTVVLDDPYDDPKDLAVPSSSPPPTQEMLDSDRIPCDADIHEDEGKTEEELAEMQAAREAKANTQILEMVGDLPDADVAPPENVLFVCKLNPVTTSDDLEIIFSRFGNIVSCEIIKDSKTGESLQYGFVEFETEEQCTNAYFKMDNVLIDDRRIHVDFSQSVSKLKWKGKGKGVEIQKDGNAPAFVLKNQERQSHGYELVYAEDDLTAMASLKDKKSKKDDNKGRGDARDTRDKMQRRDRSEEDRQQGHYDKKGRRKDDKRDRFEDRRGQHDKTDRRKDHQAERDANSHRSLRQEEHRRDAASDSDQDRRRPRGGRDHSEKKKRRQDSPDDSYSDEARQKKRKKEKKKKHNRNDDEEEKKSHKTKKKKRVENDSSEDENERRRERKRDRY